jgi:hypothetical protein
MFKLGCEQLKKELNYMTLILLIIGLPIAVIVGIIYLIVKALKK